MTFEEVVDFAAENNLECLEVACWPATGAKRRYAGVSHIDAANLTEEKAKEIDEEIQRIIRQCHDQAREIISQHIQVLHSCAELLLQKEKVHRDEFESLFTMEKNGDKKTNIQNA